MVFKMMDIKGRWVWDQEKKEYVIENQAGLKMTIHQFVYLIESDYREKMRRVVYYGKK
jgi:hypothetical protein